MTKNQTGSVDTLRELTADELAAISGGCTQDVPPQPAPPPQSTTNEPPPKPPKMASGPIPIIP